MLVPIALVPLSNGGLRNDDAIPDFLSATRRVLRIRRSSGSHSSLPPTSFLRTFDRSTATVKNDFFSLLKMGNSFVWASTCGRHVSLNSKKHAGRGNFRRQTSIYNRRATARSVVFFRERNRFSETKTEIAIVTAVKKSETERERERSEKGRKKGWVIESHNGDCVMIRAVRVKIGAMPILLYWQQVAAT